MSYYCPLCEKLDPRQLKSGVTVSLLPLRLVLAITVIRRRLLLIFVVSAFTFVTPIVAILALAVSIVPTATCITSLVTAISPIVAVVAVIALVVTVVVIASSVAVAVSRSPSLRRLSQLLLFTRFLVGCGVGAWSGDHRRDRSCVVLIAYTFRMR